MPLCYFASLRISPRNALKTQDQTQETQAANGTLIWTGTRLKLIICIGIHIFQQLTISVEMFSRYRARPSIASDFRKESFITQFWTM